MSTEAQLKALSNSELASGTQIPALKHRTVNNAIIEEMYDSQSRGDVLSGVQSALSLASGDQVLVIRSGAAFLLDATEFGFVDTLADLTDVSIPSPANDQVLAYNSGTSKWVAKDVNDLTSVVSITGAATTNQMVKFTGANSIGDSIVSDNGTTVNIGGNLSVDNNLTVGTINSGTSSDFVKGDGSLDSTDYQGQISANTSAISTNQSNITTNASNISTNASNIATNTSDISDNASDIITNANNISTNTSDIATNTSNISTNTSNIATNTSNIATNTSNISTNTSDIATNTSNIATNTSDIADLQNDKQDTIEKGQANGYAPLDSGAKIPTANLPDSVLGQVTYEGTWNASTNTPTLANPPASTTKGDYYVVNTGGTQFSIQFQVGDWIISNGTAWEKVDNTDAVTSVFGRLGNVVANSTDYASFYPPNSRTINAGTGLTGGGDLSANRTISHADTSSQGSVNNSDLTFIQDVTLDPFGHVTGLGSATVTLPTVNDDTITLSAGTGLSGGGAFTLNQGSAETITFNNTDRGSSQSIFKNVAVGGQSTIVADSNNDTLTFAAGSNVTITTNASTDTVTINSSFTDTNNFVNSASFNTGNGVLTLGRSGLSDVTVDLDGRYRTSAQLLSFALGTLNLTDSPSVDLQTYFDGRYVQSVNVYDGWNLSATTGGSTLIGENETVTFIDGINTTATRVANTIQIDAAFTETDTLDSVTDRGNTTTNSITVGGATINGTVTANSFSGNGSALTSVNAATLGGEAITKFMLYANPSDINWTNGKVASYQNGEFVPVAIPSAAFTSFNLAATVGGSTTITDGETVTFVDGLNTTATRVGNTIQIDTALASNVAYTDVNNNFSVGQTIGGNTTINGDLTIPEYIRHNGDNSYFGFQSNDNFWIGLAGSAYYTFSSTQFRSYTNVKFDGTLIVDGATTVNNNTTINGNLTVDTDTLFVDATNNRVGIGTTSPSFTAGNKGIHIADVTSPAIRLQDTNNANSDFTIYSPNGVNDLRIYHENQARDLFEISSSKATFNVDATINGVLTVDTSTNRMLRLDGDFTGGFTTQSIYRQGVEMWREGIGANNEFLILSEEAGSNQRLTILQNGNVGIGETSPNDKLHVYDATSNVVANFESGDSDCWISFKDNTTLGYDRAYLGVSGEDMLFHTSSLARMRIDSSGNVGIGKSPAGGVKLDVNGKIVSGDIDCARINTDDPGLGAGLWKLGKARVASTVTGNTVVRVEIDGVDYDLITTTVTPT